MVENASTYVKILVKGNISLPYHNPVEKFWKKQIPSYSFAKFSDIDF